MNTMTHANPSMHRSVMASLRIAHITEPAERRMQTQTASDQLRFALAETQAERHAASLPANSFDLCKYLVGV